MSARRSERVREGWDGYARVELNARKNVRNYRKAGPMGKKGRFGAYQEREGGEKEQTNYKKNRTIAKARSTPKTCRRVFLPLRKGKKKTTRTTNRRKA